MSQSTKGTCTYCGNDYTGRGISRHLQACDARQAAIESEAPKETIYHLRVQGMYNSDYWLNIEMSGKRTLADLDEFLRAIWLECCGHLSAFEINGKRYSVSPMGGYGEVNMKKKLSSVLTPDAEFSHEYDFGTPTDLTLRVMEVRQGEWTADEDWRILARNQAPAYTCTECKDAVAAHICQQCIWEEDSGLLCDACAKSHECEDYMLLPLVNSPRAGECGFDGARLT